MVELDDELKRCLLGILQCGISHSCNAIFAGRNIETAHLLDALDGIPIHLACWTEFSYLEIERNLLTFHDKYPKHPTSYAMFLAQRYDFRLPRPGQPDGAVEPQGDDG